MNASATRITVAGGGSWGTALAHHCATLGMDVTLWLRDAAVAEAVNARHENPRYLRGCALHKGVRATTDTACLGSDIVILAIPTQQLRTWLEANAAAFCERPVCINAAKGLEVGSLEPPSHIVARVLAEKQPQYAVLSGPSFAAEVVRGLPTAVVLASADAALGARLRENLSGPTLRCYSSMDVAGVELGGALKNVMAIAAGVCDGLGLGHNSRAGLITRGLAEMSRLGCGMGANAHTFMGLSGLGDLTLTCTGDLSRNRQVGLRLGQGESLEHITASLGMVAEGVKTTAAVHELAAKLGIEAPITAAVHAILFEGQAPAEALRQLMARTLKDE